MRKVLTIEEIRKSLFLQNALELFSQSGYKSISIRDISGSVKIKESSIYYHFKNKQDILDSLVSEFEKRINELTEKLQAAIKDVSGNDPLSLNWMSDFYFEKYLFDPFCNKMMRFMMIEQFHDEKMRQLYEHYLFELPKAIQMNTFLLLSQDGVMTKQQAVECGENFFAAMTTLTFRYLLTGELTTERKEAFRSEAAMYMRNFSMEG